jgi:hypothetical protein
MVGVRAIRRESGNESSRRAILKQVNTLAWLMDNSLALPLVNYRVGLDPLIGLIPGVGDIIGAIVSSFIVVQAVRMGVPSPILAQMVTNIAIESLVGIVPIVGDFFDATFKANVRNVELLNQVAGTSPSERAHSAVVGKGIIAGIVGALIGFVFLVGAAGIALFSWLLSFLH